MIDLNQYIKQRREQYIKQLCEFLAHNASEQDLVEYYKQDRINYLKSLSESGFYNYLYEIGKKAPVSYKKRIEENPYSVEIAEVLTEISRENMSEQEYRDYFLRDHIEMLENSTNYNIGRFYDKNKHKLTEEQQHEMSLLRV